MNGNSIIQEPIRIIIRSSRPIIPIMMVSIWGWGTIADQVVLVVGNVRKSMVEFHDILWDLGYATSYVRPLFSGYPSSVAVVV